TVTELKLHGQDAELGGRELLKPRHRLLRLLLRLPLVRQFADSATGRTIRAPQPPHVIVTRLSTSARSSPQWRCSSRNATRSRSSGSVMTPITTLSLIPNGPNSPVVTPAALSLARRARGLSA